MIAIVPNGSKILIWKQITTVKGATPALWNCSQWFKDTNLKANHNIIIYTFNNQQIVPNGSKILIWKQITTKRLRTKLDRHCSQWFKDTNLKANHNCVRQGLKRKSIVPNGSKILIWKQITTICEVVFCCDNCSQWFKDTNLKANHNSAGWLFFNFYCFQWFKVTNLKVNHNPFMYLFLI